MEILYALLLSVLTLMIGLRISRGSQEENCDMWAMVKAQRELQAVRVQSRQLTNKDDERPF